MESMLSNWKSWARPAYCNFVTELERALFLVRVLPLPMADINSVAIFLHKSTVLNAKFQAEKTNLGKNELRREKVPAGAGSNISPTC